MWNKACLKLDLNTFSCSALLLPYLLLFQCRVRHLVQVEGLVVPPQSCDEEHETGERLLEVTARVVVPGDEFADEGRHEDIVAQCGFGRLE